jgi:hypothetical protein
MKNGNCKRPPWIARISTDRGKCHGQRQLQIGRGLTRTTATATAFVGISASRLDRSAIGLAVTAGQRNGHQRRSAISARRAVEPQLPFTPLSKLLQFFMLFILLHVLPVAAFGKSVAQRDQG